MANTIKKCTMQGVGFPVSAASTGEKAGPRPSSSCDRSFVEMGTLASTKYKVTRKKNIQKSASVHVHEDPSKPDTFCYVCGEYQVPNNRREISEAVVDAYKYCFACEVKNQETNWVPHTICGTCHKMLTTCHKKKDRLCLKYSTPVMWSVPKSQSDCYFCMTNTYGYNSKNRSKIQYAIVTSVAQAVMVSTKSDVSKKHEEESSMEGDVTMEIREEEEIQMSEEVTDGSESEIESDSSSECEYGTREKLPQKFSQVELSDLGRELGLSKEAHELLASRLKQKNLLEKGTKITMYRNREQKLRQFFTKDEVHELVYCNDVDGLINSLKDYTYKPEQWRLFIDSSVRSLKAILLHNTNVLASIPIAHSTVLKESYENMKILLEKIKYSDHQWQICGDLKMIGILLGMQSGNVKFPCFLCLFDSRDRQNHYKRKKWTERTFLLPGSANVIRPPLVSDSKVLIPPLHIKLGLMKQFVKALDKDGNCFQYIAKQIPKLSDAKLEAGIFDGPQIRKLFKDSDFTVQMTNTEKAAWISFREVSQNFLGNHRSLDYKKIISNMIRNYQKLGCNMSIKLHFLDSHIDYFPDKLGDFSEEQGERCHQDLKDIEKRYQGTWGVNMMADFCWSLKRDEENYNGKRKRKSLRRSFESKQVRYHKRMTDDE